MYYFKKWIGIHIGAAIDVLSLVLPKIEEAKPRTVQVKEIDSADSFRASVLLVPLGAWSAHVVQFGPVRDGYGHEHSSNETRPRSVAKPIPFFSL